MRARDVACPGEYYARVSGRVVKVRLLCPSPYKGWEAVNTETGRAITVRTAARLRPLVVPRKPLGPMPCGYVREDVPREERRAHYDACQHEACRAMARRLVERDAERTRAASVDVDAAVATMVRS